MRQLYRSRTQKVIGGVCGGLAEYLGVDAALVRLALVLFSLAGGSGLLVYLLAMVIIPEEPLGAPKAAEGTGARDAAGQADRPMTGENGEPHKAFGFIMVGLGGLLLVQNFFPLLSPRFMWPIGLVAVGLYLVLGRQEKK